MTGLPSPDAISHLQNLELFNWLGATTPQLQALRLPRSITRFELSGIYSDEALQHLSHLLELRELQLRDAKSLVGPGLAHLKPLTRLRILDLFQSGITDEAAPHLKALPSLRVLNLTGTQISAAAAAEIQAALPQCILFHESLP